MEYPEIIKRYKNRSFSIFLISAILLAVLPIFFYFGLGNFSGFGFIIVNSQVILNMQKLSLFSLILGLSIPFTILLSSIFSGLKRNFIANVFPILTNFTIYGLILYFVFLAILFAYTFFAFLNEIAGLRIIFIIIGFAITLAMLTAVPHITKGISHFVKRAPMMVVGVSLNKKDHAKIFSLIDQMSTKINARKPKNIIIGLTTDFYATSANVRIFNGVKKKLLKGETLYISLPYLRVLTIKEFEGIVGHELGHFEGADTLYCVKFSPIYSRLNEQFRSLSKDEAKESILIKLAVYPIIFLFNEFSRKEEKISKAQELKADVFGSKASGDAKVFINGLAKLYIYGLVWDDVEDGYREIVRQKVKTKIENLSMEFVSFARKNLDKKKLLEFLERIADYQQEHPNDTHPPLKERMENLNVKLDDMTNKSLMNFLPSSASLIPNVDIIEENMTTIIKIIEERRS